MKQLEFIDEAPSSGKPKLSLAARWREFHRRNPQVYAAFERFTLEAIRSGASKIGAKAVWERMRWWAHVESRGDDWRLNNSWTALYAREFLRRHPEHKGVFELRRSKADREGGSGVA